MKAIHNKYVCIIKTCLVGNYMLKYNFESNSQRVTVETVIAQSWELYAKIQF